MSESRAPQIEIVPFDEGPEDAIKTLNEAWLEKYFKIEEGDKISLSNPKREIIEKGGLIFYARFEGRIIGTASLLRKTSDVFELGKMAVAENVRGLGAGGKLIEHCLQVAKQLSVKKLILYSNRRLEPALHLYRKFGFVEVPLESGLYERADIKMEKNLLDSQ